MFSFRSLVIVGLQAALVFVLLGAGWLIYRQVPVNTANASSSQRTATLQIVIRQPLETVVSDLDVPVSLYPVDIVAVRHEFFTEPRAGKRFEDFLKERMRGRSPVNLRLDKEGQGAVMIAPGSWWLHATLSGDEQLEWRLPVTIVSARQTIELTSQNAYTRSKTF
jgi:hypothetical protein